jgi:PadR family transcriptional regulator, regulatory protein PadR
VEARWQDEPQTGRPRRHLYRLTTDGLAAAARASVAEPAALPEQRPRLARPVVAMRVVS